MYVHIHISYSYKYSRDLIFAVFVDNLLSTKSNPQKCKLWRLENKTIKMLNFGHQRNLNPMNFVQVLYVYVCELTRVLNFYVFSQRG